MTTLYLNWCRYWNTNHKTEEAFYNYLAQENIENLIESIETAIEDVETLEELYGTTKNVIYIQEKLAALVEELRRYATNK